MGFLPARRDDGPAVVTVAGTVTADQGAAGAAAWPVSGPLTAAQLAAAEPLSVTGAGGGAVLVDGSAVTQPISAEALPLPDGAADNDTLSEVALSAILERDRMATE